MDVVAQPAAWLIAQFYAWTHSYAISIGLVSVVLMIVLTPLTLKSTKGMLEMQRLQPEMRRIQAEFKSDRQKMNEAMMRLYQEHKVNPLSSCLPILAQLPIFIVMFQAMNGLTRRGEDGTFVPRFLDVNSELYRSLAGQREMRSFGLDLARTPVNALDQNFATGLVYVGLVVLLAGVYFVQQRMVASRMSSPTMSATQAKIFQYMPVGFSVFQVVLPTSLVVYYFTQAVIRIAQQAYITRRFYGSDESLGRQAQAAGARAREIANEEKSKKSAPSGPTVSRRVTPPKGGAAQSRPASPPAKGGSNWAAQVPRKKKK
jgi:YidC/Oxa1 family membrane protein insertase